MKRGSLLAFALFGVLSSAFAQSRNSFADVDSITGVQVTSIGNQYTVSVTSGASFVLGGQTYTIQDLFGFWLLDDNDDLSGNGADFDV